MGCIRLTMARRRYGWEADLLRAEAACNVQQMEEEDAKQAAMDELRAWLVRKPASGRELVEGCRTIIQSWIGADLPYPHNLLDPIVGIESQTDHLELDEAAEEQQLREVHAFFSRYYERSTVALWRHLNSVGQAT